MIEKIPLESEKYWQASVAQQAQFLKRNKNRRAIGSLLTFLVGYVVIVGTGYAAENVHAWMPSVLELFSSNNLLNG